MKRILFGLLGLIGLAIIGLCLYIVITGQYFAFNAIHHLTADIDDYKFFTNNTIHKSQSPHILPRSKGYNKKEVPDSLLQFFTKIESVAIFVVNKDSVLFEKYDKGYNDTTVSGSFSVAKTVIGLLIGKAQSENLLNINDPVYKYIPEFKDKGRDKITIKNLLQMGAGLKFDESYLSMFSKTTEAYYGDELTKMVTDLEPERPIGQYFNYQSINTEILGLIIKNVTHGSVAKYCEEKLWIPLGMQHDAYWSVDHKDGIEKAFCCLNATASDFAKIGLLIYHKGKWNNQQILPESYIREMITPNNLIDLESPTKQKCDFYGYQLWIGEHNGKQIPYARGIGGQQIIIYPEANSVVVRLGIKRGLKSGHHYEDFDKLCTLADILNK